MAENAESIVEEEVVEEVEEIEGELAEVVEETEEDEVEIVLEGEEEPAPHKIPRRVKKLLERNNALTTDLETTSQASTAQAQEIERLKTELARSTAVSVEMPLPPTDEECGFDADKLIAAQTQYKVNMQQWVKSQTAGANEDTVQEQAQNQRAQLETQALEDHYKRADSLKVSNYDVNEAAAVESLGKNVVKSIAMMLPNSAMVINYLGANPGKAQEIADLDKTNPQAGVAKLWELNFGLKAKPRKRSNAPEPEERVEGGDGGSVNPLQKKYDKATEAGNIKERRKLRAVAKEKGIKLED